MARSSEGANTPVMGYHLGLHDRPSDELSPQDCDSTTKNTPSFEQELQDIEETSNVAIKQAKKKGKSKKGKSKKGKSKKGKSKKRKLKKGKSKKGSAKQGDDQVPTSREIPDRMKDTSELSTAVSDRMKAAQPDVENSEATEQAEEVIRQEQTRHELDQLVTPAVEAEKITLGASTLLGTIPQSKELVSEDLPEYLLLKIPSSVDLNEGSDEEQAQSESAPNPCAVNPLSEVETPAQDASTGSPLRLREQEPVAQGESNAHPRTDSTSSTSGAQPNPEDGDITEALAPLDTEPCMPATTTKSENKSGSPVLGSSTLRGKTSLTTSNKPPGAAIFPSSKLSRKVGLPGTMPLPPVEQPVVGAHLGSSSRLRPKLSQPRPDKSFEAAPPAPLQKSFASIIDSAKDQCRKDSAEVKKSIIGFGEDQLLAGTQASQGHPQSSNVATSDGHKMRTLQKDFKVALSSTLDLVHGQVSFLHDSLASQLLEASKIIDTQADQLVEKNYQLEEQNLQIDQQRLRIDQQSLQIDQQNKQIAQQSYQIGTLLGMVPQRNESSFPQTESTRHSQPLGPYPATSLASMSTGYSLTSPGIGGFHSPLSTENPIDVESPPLILDPALPTNSGLRMQNSPIPDSYQAQVSCSIKLSQKPTGPVDKASTSLESPQAPPLKSGKPGSRTGSSKTQGPDPPSSLPRTLEGTKTGSSSAYVSRRERKPRPQFEYVDLYDDPSDKVVSSTPAPVSKRERK